MPGGVGLCAAVAQVRHRAAEACNAIGTMAAIARLVVYRFAHCNFIGCRLKWRLVRQRRIARSRVGHFCLACDGKRHEPDRPFDLGRCMHFRISILKATGCAYRNQHILRAIDRIARRRGVNCRAGVDRPELFAGRRSVGNKFAICLALEHEVATRRHYAAVVGQVMVY